MSNPVTTITYHLYRDSGLGPYRIGPEFDSEAKAKLFAIQQQSTIEEYYEIRSQIVTTTTLDSFTVPAHVPTLDEIARDIIDGSNGSFYLEWGDDIDRLSDADRSKVEDMVWQEIDNCEHCGWHFHHENMENVDGENLCWKCAEDAYNNEDEEENEDED